MLADVFVAHFPFADSIDPSQSDVNVLIQIDIAKLSSIQDTPAGNRPYSMLHGNSAPEGQNKYLQHNERPKHTRVNSFSQPAFFTKNQEE
jgi:hypothetical protein